MSLYKLEPIHLRVQQKLSITNLFIALHRYLLLTILQTLLASKNEILLDALITFVKETDINIWFMQFSELQSLV